MSNSKPKAGKIRLIVGPMYSSKTTTMISKIDRYYVAKKRCLIIRPKCDDRYDDKAVNKGIVTHAGAEYSKVPYIRLERLADADTVIQEYDVLGVDEGQLFLDAPETLQRWANAGKIIVVSALDGTFQAKPYNRIHELAPFCEKVKKLNAICKLCFADASFTKRTTTDTRQDIIGGEEMYMAVCRNCMWADN